MGCLIFFGIPAAITLYFATKQENKKSLNIKQTFLNKFN